MLQLTPHSRIVLAIEPVDFRQGIDRRAALCRQALAENPRSGALEVCRNRAGTALQILCYDGQGSWLCTKRWSQGRFRDWPTAAGPHAHLAARARAVLLWNGAPAQARMAEEWQPVRSGGASMA
jgi:transposase